MYEEQWLHKGNKSGYTFICIDFCIASTIQIVPLCTGSLSIRDNTICTHEYIYVPDSSCSSLTFFRLVFLFFDSSSFFRLFVVFLPKKSKPEGAADALATVVGVFDYTNQWHTTTTKTSSKGNEWMVRNEWITRFIHFLPLSRHTSILHA